jgi:phospholipase/carboxylesterase
MNETAVEFDSKSELVYRYQKVEDGTSLSVIMLHGLGGDENAMWVLVKALPKVSWIVAPRGLFPLSKSSFSWVSQTLSGWPTAQDFQASIGALKTLVEELEDRDGFFREHVVFMGFSQGAALAFSAATDPELRPKAIISAAGFLPKGDFTNLEDLPVFWGHGSRDEWIPIEKARSEANLLRDFGVRIRFCEADVAHKLGIECLNGLKTWMERFLDLD